MLFRSPHVTFYFRPEVHVVSEENLNVYGAVTWGQFFVYQGFNEHCGWMHTTSYNDASDSYIEKIQKTDGKWFYEYDGKQKPASVKNYTVYIKQGNELKKKQFQTLFTGHGPVIAKRAGNFLSLKADNRISNGLIQCWYCQEVPWFFYTHLNFLSYFAASTGSIHSIFGYLPSGSGNFLLFSQ